MLRTLCNRFCFVVIDSSMKKYFESCDQNKAVIFFRMYGAEVASLHIYIDHAMKSRG